MRVVRLSGSPSEMGYVVGTQLRGVFKPPEASEAKRLFTRKCIPLIEEHVPGILDELDALSEAIGEDRELIMCFILTLGLDPRCTVFALAGKVNAEATPLFARNYDWDPSFLQHFLVIKAEPSGKHNSLSFTDHMVGRYGGVNDEGLACAITAAPAYMGKPRPGVRMNLAVRWILDNLDSTEQAVDWLKSVPHQWAHNYLIADSRGSLARLESSPEKNCLTTSTEFIHLTNHYIDEDMRQLEDTEFDYSNSTRRFDIIQRWYEGRDSISLEDVKWVLSSHEGGVCNHTEEFETIWSWIAPLGERFAYVCHGSPCKGEYACIEF